KFQTKLNKNKTMEKNEKIIATIFVGMLVLALLPVISAAALTVTIGAPANYTNASTSFSYSCTTSAARVKNISVYANSTAGVMNLLQVFTNVSALQTKWNGTVSIQAADDGSNQNISCYADNTTARTYSNEKGSWHVRLDSTNPSCNISVAHNNIAYKTLQTVTWASSDVTARRLTSVDVNGPGVQTTIQSTAASRTLDMGSNATKYSGSWVANMTVTDWSGNSCTSSTTFKSYMPDGVTAEEEAQQAATTQNNGAIWLLIGAVVLYFIFKKK
ncbi:MAG: hypothetical protein Q7K43_05375, partial [Candidatus Woesearchaeota archaeon]|nr:hypothetical protein [Candidatus Woesearchaeota archaeon]